MNGKVTSFKDIQYEKVIKPTELKLVVARSAFSKLKHKANASSPIVSSVVGKITSFNDIAALATPEPMVVTPSGNTIFVILLSFLNTSLAITLIPSGITTSPPVPL